MPEKKKTFDPTRLAMFEAALWRAYYDRNIPLGLILMVRLSREQFGLSWIGSLRGAYHILRATIAWAPKRNKPEEAHRCLSRFYALAAAEQDLPFDPERVASLELRYWRLHRDLVGVPDKLPLIEALAELHAAIFHRPVEEMRPSATYRARAAGIVDEITSRRSPDPAGDWRRVEENLLLAYRHILEQCEPRTRKPAGLQNGIPVQTKEGLYDEDKADEGSRKSCLAAESVRSESYFLDSRFLE